MIHIDSIKKTYGKKTVLNISNLNFNKSGIIGLIGSNGAGKTTLLLAISGKIRTDKDSKFSVLNKLPYNNLNIMNQIGYFHDEMNFMSNKLYKIIEEYTYFYNNFDSNKCLSILSIFNLDKNKKYNTLSKGMKSQFITSLAISCGFKIILLDEPTAFMDQESRYIFGQLLKKEKDMNDKLYIISTHLAEELKDILDESVVLNNGKLLCHQILGENADKLNLTTISSENTSKIMENLYAKS